jgi:hypothetical protein
MKEKRNKVISIITAIFIGSILAWGFSWLLIASYYTVPNAEDYSSINVIKRLGLIESLAVALVVDYTRYTSNFFYGFNILTLHLHEYFWIMPVTCIIFLVISFYYFITSLVKTIDNKLKILTYSLLFVLLHFAVEPNIYYGLYYMVSIIDFVYPWFFAFLWMGSLIRAIRYIEGKKSILYFFTGYLFLILSYGGAELFVSINPFLLLPFFVYALIYERTKWKYVIPYCIVAISCTLFLIFCPSPKITSENIFSDLHIRFEGSNFVTESLKTYLKFYWECMLNPISVCLILITTLCCFRMRIFEQLHFHFNAKIALWLFLLSVFGGYINTLVYFIPKGNINDYPKLIYNCIGIYCQLGLYLALPLFLSEKIRSLRKVPSLSIFEPVLGLLMLAMIVWGTNNISLIKKEFDAGYIEDVKYKADKFYSEVSEIKKRGKPPYIVYFENPDVIPSTTFYATDIKPNREAGFWNIAYEDYFEVDEVRLKGDTIFK